MRPGPVQLVASDQLANNIRSRFSTPITTFSSQNSTMIGNTAQPSISTPYSGIRLAAISVSAVGENQPARDEPAMRRNIPESEDSCGPLAIAYTEIIDQLPDMQPEQQDHG